MEIEELRFVTLFPNLEGSAPVVALAVRRATDPVNGWFVPLPEVPDGDVFLGALLDGSGRPRLWLEIWVQRTNRHDWHKLADAAALNNQFLDQKWRERCDVLDRLEPGAVIAGPWQGQHPLPCALVPQQLKLVPIAPDKSGPCWRLCEDDSVLKQAGLPTFSHSSFRYLHLPDKTGGHRFIALHPVPLSTSTVVLPNHEQGFRDDQPVFNLEGGLLFIRTLSPLSIGQFKRILEGYGYSGVGNGEDKLHLSETYALFEDLACFTHNHGLIFSGKTGRSGRLLESFLLKLTLFEEMVDLVARVTEIEKRPFVNLSATDFRIQLDTTMRRLPALWSFRLRLGRTSESVPLKTVETGLTLFKPLVPVSASPYLPKRLATLRTGICSLRVREIEGKAGTPVTLHGTLTDLNVTSLEPSDVMEISLPLAGGRQTFLAQPLRDQNLAASELRIETIPRVVAEHEFHALSRLKGVWTESVGFQVTPIVSSPADLYALAVIGLEILIDSRKISLPVALDECISLATQIGRTAGASKTIEPLSERRRRIVELEPRFIRSLGPQNLCKESDAAKVVDAIPPALWWGYIDILIRMFPGLGSDSFARDLGDVNPLALESCYQELTVSLRSLSEQARSLLFGDLPANREALSVLSEFD